MPAQPEPIATTLPGLPKALVAQHGQRRRAACWTPGENQFADWAIQEWNKLFKGVPGGYRAYNRRRNVFAAISFYRRNEERPPDERFSRGDILRALQAYRHGDPRKQAWTTFGNWWREAEENIGHYRGQSRIEEHRTAQPKAAKKRVDAKVARRTAAARKVIEHENIVHYACIAARQKLSLRAYLAPLNSAHKLAREVTAIINHRETLERTAIDALANRARRVFEAFYHRVPGADPADRTRLDAISLSLLDLDMKGVTVRA